MRNEAPKLAGGASSHRGLGSGRLYRATTAAPLLKIKRLSGWVVIWFALGWLSAFSFTSRVLAQEDALLEAGVFRSNSLEMVVRAGFGRLEVNRALGTWVPFRIMLTNNGDPISGKLVVRAETSQGGPNRRQREFIKEIQLPTASRQFHEIPAFLSSTAEVRLVSGDQVLAQTKVNVTSSFGFFGNEQLEIAVVDTDTTALNDISSTEIVRPTGREPFRNGRRSDKVEDQEAKDQSIAPPVPGPRGRGPRRWGWPANPPAHPTIVLAEDLPRSFVSYDLIDVVVLGDAPLSQLTEDQVRALKLWVASGGLLILTGATDVAGLRASGLDSISPVEPRGAVTAPSLEPLTTTYNQFESPDALLIMSARTRAGARTLIGDPERALVAESNYGSGLVRFVAINPKLRPYRGWGAAKNLWIDLLLPAAEAKPRLTNWITMGPRVMPPMVNNRWGIQNFLFELAEIEPTSPNYFLLFLLAYLLTVGPLNYLVLRWFRKTDLAWLTIPAVVILFTAISVTVAQVSRGADPVAADVSLVEVHQRDRVARVTSGLLIMPTSKGTHDITFEGRDTFATDVVDGGPGSSSSSIDDIEFERNGSQFVMHVPMNTWTAGIFQIRSVIDEAQPIASVVSDAGAVPQSNGPDQTVIIRNLGDVAIMKAAYLSAQGVSLPFDLAVGQEQRVSLVAAPNDTFATWYAAQLANEPRELTVFNDLAPVLDREIGGQPGLGRDFFSKQQMAAGTKRLERPMLVGFVDKPPSRIEFGSSLKRRSKALYVVHL